MESGERNAPYKRHFASHRLHNADGATMDEEGNTSKRESENKLVTTKEWLIDFYCEEAYKIVRESEKHSELMNRFYERNKKK